MMDLTDITGLASTGVFLTALASLVPAFHRGSTARRFLLMGIFILMLLVPLRPVSVAVYIRSVIGDLSIPTLVILFLLIVEKIFSKSPFPRKHVELFSLWSLPVILLFYPMALGLGRYDPYSLGFGSPYLLGIAFAFTLLAWAANRLLISFVLSLSVFCYAIGWYESNNLWDYLIDPVLGIYGLSIGVKRLFRIAHFRYRRIAGLPLTD
jgi:hypothetical protein